LAQIFDPPQYSGASGEGLKGDGHTPSVSGRVFRSPRRGREDENTLSVTKEEVGGAEEEPSVAKEEIRVRKDAVQEN
jgi:hypothetical protein